MADKEQKSQGNPDDSYKPYAKVVIKGVIALTALSGIWSALADIVSLQTFPTIRLGGTTTRMYYIYEGIHCSTPSQSVFGAQSKGMCGDVAEQMANQTASHPEWDCDNLLNGVNLISDGGFYGIQSLFAVAVVSMAMAVFYSVVHDFALIYYHRKRELKSLVFWPGNDLKKDFPLASCVPSEQRGSPAAKLVLNILLFIIMFSVMVFEAVFNLLCCGLPHRRREGLSMWRWCLKGMVEVSACGAGLASAIVVLCALSFARRAVSPLLYSIEEPLNDD